MKLKMSTFYEANWIFQLQDHQTEKKITSQLILQLHKCYDMPLKTPTHKLTD